MSPTTHDDSHTDEEDKTIRCSFCGKERSEARRLVAGPNGVYICDECILLCFEVIGGDHNYDLKQRQADLRAEEEPVPAELADRIRRHLLPRVEELARAAGATEPAATIQKIVSFRGSLRVDIVSPVPGALIGTRGETLSSIKQSLQEQIGSQPPVVLNVASPA